MNIPPILEIGGILISSEILTEYFCCDYEKCKGICCVEGSDGAPVTIDEIASIEDALDTVWPTLSASAQSVIDQQGVAYADRDGDMVTSIVRGRDCVFTCYDGDNCLCALEKAYREGMSNFCKPILPQMDGLQGCCRQRPSRTHPRLSVSARTTYPSFWRIVVRRTVRSSRPTIT